MGRVTQALSFIGIKNFDAAKNVFSGLNTETMLATSGFSKLSEAQITSVFKAVGYTAQQTAPELALKGAGEVTVRTALETVYYEAVDIQAAIAATKFTAAENAIFVSTDTLGASLKATVQGLLIFLTTNPAGWQLYQAQDRAVEKTQEVHHEYVVAQENYNEKQPPKGGCN